MQSVVQKVSNIIFLFFCLICLASCETTNQAVIPRTTDTVEVAILMPMSGPQGLIGQQYNKLIKMGIEDGIKTQFKITSYDGADESQVLNAMTKIIAKNTKIILGPIYSPLTSLIAEQAKRHNIILITMSNNPALADDKLFVFGHAPLKQLDRMINSLLDNDYKNFIALLPAGNHSHNMTKIIQNLTIQKNATLVRAEYYSDTPEAIDKSIHLVSDAVDNINEMEDNAGKPVVYIANDSKSLNLLFGSINKYNLDKKAIIAGDNRIDIEYPQAVDIIFTGSLNILTSNVPERAKELGIAHVSFMHGVAYDLGRLTAEYVGEKFSQERFLGRLNSKEVFVGISGNISFTDSIAQRRYDIIKREDGVYSTLKSN